MTTFVHIHDAGYGHGIAGTIDSVGWGTFFVWIGIAFLADVGWGPGLVGVGFIMLAAQAARAYFELKMDWLRVLVAAVLFASGVARWLDLSPATVSLPAFVVPLILIAIGVAILISAWKHWRHE